jgi:hypothetical protein
MVWPARDMLRPVMAATWQNCAHQLREGGLVAVRFDVCDVK